MGASKLNQLINGKSGLIFWLHLMVVFISWAAPFLVRWTVIVPIYLIVLLQFRFFGKCLVNQMHQLSTADDNTIYAELLEWFGFQPNHKTLKLIVHRYLYPVLIFVTLIWQVVLKHAPLWF